MRQHESDFVWDPVKEEINIKKHGVDFRTAAKAFRDPKRKIYVDARHNQQEERLFCIGQVETRIITVRFIYRDGKVRIIGAGYWRKGVSYYDKKD